MLDIPVPRREMEHARQPIRCGVPSNNDTITLVCFNVSFYRLIGFCQENGSYKGCAFEMPEVDNEYFKRQLNNLGLDNEEAIEQCVEVATVGDYEDQEWRPPQD